MHHVQPRRIHARSYHESSPPKVFSEVCCSNLQRSKGIEAYGKKERVIMTAGQIRYDDKLSKENRVLCSGSLAISIFALFELLPQSSLDCALHAAMYCFAVSIPLTAMSIYVTTIEVDYQNAARPINVFMALMSLGLVATIAGVGALFVHMAAITEYVHFLFGGVCLLAIVFGIIFRKTARSTQAPTSGG
jgi:hypothetical protein